MKLLKSTFYSGIVATAMIALVACALIIGSMLREQRSGSQSSQSSSGRAVPELTVAADPLVNHDNPTLGYRISLPATYRLAKTSIVPGSSTFLGIDTFTLLSEAEDRANCLQDLGEMPSTAIAASVHVEAYRNPASVSPVAWATTSHLKTPRATVQLATVGGLSAARLMEDGLSSAYVIAANARLYALFSAVRPSPHALDAIASGFTAIQPQAFPTATPTVSGDAARRSLVSDLTAAVASSDVGAFAQLMTPQCWFPVSSVIESSSQTPVRGGVMNRSVSAFIDDLRGQLANGALKVSVEPAVLTQVPASGTNGTERFYVRTAWSESGRATPIDLFLGQVDGQWRIVEALHHYQRSELIRGSCIPYHRPWVVATGSC